MSSVAIIVTGGLCHVYTSCSAASSLPTLRSIPPKHRVHLVLRVERFRLEIRENHLRQISRIFLQNRGESLLWRKYPFQMEGYFSVSIRRRWRDSENLYRSLYWQVGTFPKAELVGQFRRVNGWKLFMHRLTSVCDA